TGVTGAGGGVPGVSGAVRALVVHQGALAAVGQAAHPAAAVPAADPAPVGIGPGRGRVGVQAVAVAAGAVLGADLLGGLPGGPVHDEGVDGLGCPEPLVGGDGDAVAVAFADPAVDHVAGVFGVAEDGEDGLGGPAFAGGGGVAGRVGVEPGGDGGHAELVYGPPGEDLRHDRGPGRVPGQPGLGAALAGLDRHRVRPPVGEVPVRR